MPHGKCENIRDFIHPSEHFVHWSRVGSATPAQRPGSSNLRFCAILAALGVALRVVLIDHAFLRTLHIPSHDMSQGLAFFATSMHSLRLSGDLAWWYPGSFTGYAQYFQALVGPLAPTYGHVVFIAWAHGVAILGSLGIAIPEYLQYVAINYVVFPFLAFFTFAWFCTLVLRHRASVALAVMAYVLSAIGAWHSAWFYFQEAFSVFFVLAAAIALLQRPVAARVLVLLAAILVQFASLNYWTLYNVFLVPIVLGTYAAFHRNQVVRLAVRLRALASTHRRGTVAVVAASCVVILLWTALLLAAVLDQAGSNVRNVYTPEEAVARIGELRRLTTELFNPSLERALTQYPITNDLHSARYIGITLLPLIAVGVLGVAHRRARWLVASAILILFVCLGSPLLVHAWSAIPMMDRIRHLFYFYSQYWQVALVLLAAVGFDVLLRAPSGSARQKALWLVGIATAAAATTMAVTLMFTHTYPLGDVNLQAILRGALLLGLASAVLFRGLWLDLPRERSFACAAFLLLLFLDLSAYFYAAARADLAFTTRITSFPQSPEQRAVLREPWSAPRPERGFAAAFEQSLPIKNMFWPLNTFMTPASLNPRAADAVAAHARGSEPFAFYDGAIRVPWGAAMPDALAGGAKALDAELLVADPSVQARAGGPSRRITDGFSYRWLGLRYNDFEVEVSAPRDGWLMVRQLYDRHWRASADGVQAQPAKANYVAMAIPLTAGRHVLRWEYRPPARGLYWPAAVLLEAVVALFLVVAWRASRTPAGPRRVVVEG